MNILKIKKATNKFNGVTITEISDTNNYCYSGAKRTRMTIYRRIKLLEEHGYLAQGILDNHAPTYYLLDRGAMTVRYCDNV